MVKKAPSKVLILAGVPASAEQVFHDKSFSPEEYEVEVCSGPLTEAQLAKKVEDVNIICIGPRRTEELTDEVIRSAHRLLAIGCYSTETTSVNVACASEMGIPIFSSPYQNSHSHAEFAMGQIILLARQLGDRNSEMQVGNWQKKSANCFEIRGKTLGIVGYGHAGSQLGIMAEFFGMKVVWYDHQPLMPIGNSVPLDTMNDVLRAADFISVHVSDSEDNDLLFGKEQFAMMKKGSFFLNASYRKAVDIEELANALTSGHLFGASIDTFSADDFATSPSIPKLKKCPNVILTPKLSGHTTNASHRVGHEVSIHIKRYLQEGCTQGAVNFPVIETRPLPPNKTRILNVHKNVRGVVKEINNLLSNSNISKQLLETKDTLGYAIIEMDKSENITEVLSAFALLANSIRTRWL